MYLGSSSVDRENSPLYPNALGQSSDLKSVRPLRPGGPRLEKRNLQSVTGSKNSLDVQVTLTLDNEKVLSTMALVDSGCTTSAINSKYVKEHGINTFKLERPFRAYNADGSENKEGLVSEACELRMEVRPNHIERIILVVTDLGKRSIYLGHD